ALTDREQDSVLSIGLRRSYGDSTLNPEGRLIDMTHLDRVMAFDTENGILRAEAGLALQQLLRLTVPKGWFVRTTPGTRFVTLGGAVANDVHGKNHHKVGSFGNTVRCLGLERSDGSSLVLSENENPELFRATIGGLGLTGAITWVEIELEKIASAFVDVERIPFETVDAFFTLAEASGDFEHTVAWIDASSKGRGIFQQGNWSKTGGLDPHPPKIKLSMPMDFPGFTLNKWSVRAFNEVYFRKQAAGDAKFTQHYAPFFHPLDSIGTWNRMYGQRGFYQYQCVLPPEAAKEAVRELLAQISAAGAGSFLAVLKTMGTVPSRGLLSFPREGATL
ncbi:MAG: FAD-binding protein, partial [Rhodospirillaceae bacterium]